MAIRHILRSHAPPATQLLPIVNLSKWGSMRMTISIRLLIVSSRQSCSVWLHPIEGSGGLFRRHLQRTGWILLLLQN